MSTIRIGILSSLPSWEIFTEVEGIDEHFYLWNDDESQNIDATTVDWDLCITFNTPENNINDLKNKTLKLVNKYINNYKTKEGIYAIIKLAINLYQLPEITNVKINNEMRDVIIRILENKFEPTNERYNEIMYLEKYRDVLINIMKC